MFESLWYHPASGSRFVFFGSSDKGYNNLENIGNFKICSRSPRKASTRIPHKIPPLHYYKYIFIASHQAGQTAALHWDQFPPV